METPNVMGTVKVPNFFYDLIVFMTPSLTLTIGLIIGLGNYGLQFFIENMAMVKAEGINFLLLLIFFFIVFLFLSYEYGRLAEALSNWIADAVRFFRKHNLFFSKQKDYSIDFKNEISKLNLHEMLDDDRMDKWTIYFYIMRFQPAIGSDILKRYAWEKLSRSSAFTFLILFIISLLLSLVRIFKIKSIFSYSFIDTGIFGFGSLAYTLVALMFFMLTSYEYYRRRSWNNDLLIKILPVVVLPNDFVIDKSKIESPVKKRTTRSRKSAPKRTE